jgi:hypothetical protein
MSDAEQRARANLNARTGLGTDYLNHFNEAAMLIGMLGDAPEAAEDVLAWRPRSYVEHFAVSGLRHREDAIAAYETADPCARRQLELGSAEVEGMIAQAQHRLRMGEDPQLFAIETAHALYEAINALSGIINGEA